MLGEDRTNRLLTSVRRGWSRVRSNEELRARAIAWLERHPAGWPPVQVAWLDALGGRGSIRDWLEDGADAGSWKDDIPLHSFLSSHPFACLPRWSIPRTSNES